MPVKEQEQSSMTGGVLNFEWRPGVPVGDDEYEDDDLDHQDDDLDMDDILDTIEKEREDEEGGLFEEEPDHQQENEEYDNEERGEAAVEDAI